MIESQSVNGKCYLRLLPILPGFKTCATKDLEHVIVYMATTLGSKPEGVKILAELFIANEMLKGDLSFPQTANYNSLNAMNSVDFMSKVFDSTVRFSWEEIDGVHHIGSYIETGVTSREVYTDLGYSARFVICIISNPGVLVGSQMNFSGLFDEIANADTAENEVEDFLSFEEKPKMHINTRCYEAFHDSGISDENEELKAKMTDRLKEIEVLNGQVKALQRRIADTAGHQRSPEIDELTMRRFSDLFEKQTKLKEKSPKTEIFPEDSSSHISRYNNRYLNEGTILNVDREGKTVLQTVRAHDALRPEKQIVVGYQKTNEMLIKENRIYKRVNSINGLANPFHSHRLNFLCHFDTAVRSIQVRKENYTLFDTITWISRHKSMSPSQELLHQVVINTFDLENQVVVSNPYKLPFLEVGMLLSDDCLVKCFDLVRLEYKSLWFDKMKGLLVPAFHDEFTTYKEHKLTSNKDKDKPKETREVKFGKELNSSARSRRRGSTSILGFIKE